ncbi:MAG: heme exporter protein CcmB [Salinisphaeraceae bacterium]|nr:heme exporter protein CcmB [Salinisphaeraceae bacterium]
MLKALYAILRRDLLLAWRHPGELLDAWLFFILIVCLFPLGSRPEAELLRQFAPAIIWIAALLATLLSLERIFRSDVNDGSLEQFLLSPQPLTVLVLGKVIAHWFSSGLLILLASPVLGMALGMPSSALPILMLSLLLGTPILSLLGAIAVALTSGLRGAGMLLPLLLLPLYTPVLIFGAHAVQAAAEGLPTQGALTMLAALLMLALSLAPMAISAALRISAE